MHTRRRGRKLARNSDAVTRQIARSCAPDARRLRTDRVFPDSVLAVARWFAFEFSSRLTAPAAEVWSHATSMRGVNRELFPLVRMTHPRGLESLDDVFASIARSEAEPSEGGWPRPPAAGPRRYRSWILLLGFIPIDYDDLTFIELAPGRFLERSPMLTQREWQHERRVDPVEGGCVLSDRVSFVPRIAALGPLFLPMFRMAFALRHRNLRRRFGSAV